uniref:C1q domain-containing protein n=1 Tax=Oryzias latipes TaxID=8090 RepID=A0A3P9H0V8_ORYLA
MTKWFLVALLALVGAQSPSDNEVAELTTRVEQLTARVEQLKRERDAALNISLTCGAFSIDDNLLQQLTAKVEKLERERKFRERPRVAFSAALIDSRNWTTFGPYTDDETLKLKKVITNIGGGYNPETGWFTAPVGGLYYFRVTGHVGDSDYLNAGVKKNRENLIAIHHKSKSTRGSASNAMVLELEQDDFVFFQLWRERGLTIGDQGGITTFTGFLVSPV